MNKFSYIVIGFVVLAAASLAWFSYSSAVPFEATSDMVALAQCLREKNVTMYGAEWCPHCQNEKKNFGTAFQYVPYVECTLEADRCTAAKIENYPTWIFPASPAGGPDGKRLEGEQGLRKLAGESGCPFPITPRSEQ